MVLILLLAAVITAESAFDPYSEAYLDFNPGNYKYMNYHDYDRYGKPIPVMALNEDSHHINEFTPEHLHGRGFGAYGGDNAYRYAGH